MKEERIENRLCSQLHLIDPRIKVLKLTPWGQVGYQDRLILLPGAVAIFVELKRPGSKPRKIQEFRRTELRHLGFQAEVISTMAGIDEFINHVKNFMQVTVTKLPNWHTNAIRPRQPDNTLARPK